MGTVVGAMVILGLGYCGDCAGGDRGSRRLGVLRPRREIDDWRRRLSRSERPRCLCGYARKTPAARLLVVCSTQAPS